MNTTSKPMRNALAVILRHPFRPDQFLAVQRPNEGEDLDDCWGLPAVRMLPGELPEDAARRACREKLGCDAMPIRLVGTMFQERAQYDMFFMDFEMIYTSGKLPDVKLAQTNATAYVDQRWTTDASLLLPAARAGSCCSTIFLTHLGLLSDLPRVTSVHKKDARPALPLAVVEK